uniref:Uncharacterized protein n=1 Tax=Helianthus annuus TaxID=4232 RepID=A0A251T207_HELAN
MKSLCCFPLLVDRNNNTLHTPSPIKLPVKQFNSSQVHATASSVPTIPVSIAGREDDGVVNQSKFAHTSARGGSGDGGAGRSTRENNNGYGGDSSLSRQGGGGAVIPVYAAAGAAAKRNNRHNAANTCSICWEHRLLIVMSSVLTSFLLHMRI